MTSVRHTNGLQPARRMTRAGRFVVAAAIAVFASAHPARALEIEAALPERETTTPASLLRSIATAAGVPSERIRATTGDERPHLFVKLGPPDREVDAIAKAALAILGATEAHAQLTSDGTRLHLIACTVADANAPVLPLAGVDAATPALDGGTSATLAAGLDAAKVMPWLVATAKSLDAQQGQFIADGIEVLKWNLGIDIRGDLVEQFEGAVRAAAGERDGRLFATAVVPLRERKAVERALGRLAFGSRFVADTMPSLHQTSTDPGSPYQVKAPGFEGVAFVVAGTDGLLATICEPPVDADWQDAARALAPDDTRRDASGVGVGAAVDVARAAGHIERLVRLLRIDYDASGLARVMRGAGGTATLALRVQDGRLIAWGAWVP